MRSDLSRFRFLGRFHLSVSLILLGSILMFAYGVLSFWNIRFDLTQSGIFTLSPVTAKVLEEIKNEPVNVYGFFRTDSGDREQFKELMKCYQSALRKLDVQIIDPDRSPSKTKEFRIDAYGTVIVEFRNRRERFQGVDEEKITNAMLRVIRNERKKIYFVTGHGESLLASDKSKGLTILVQRLWDENYKVEKLAILEKDVPDQASAVIVAGPKTDFQDNELARLDDYLKRGGSLLLLVDPVDSGSLKKFEKWVQIHGVHLGQDIIVDKLGKALGSDFLVPVITQYQDHPITKDFSLASFLPVSRSVSVAEPLAKGIEVKPLAYTSSSSWAETDLELLQKGEAFMDPAKDMKGPVPIACVAVKDKSKIVVFGDSDFISNGNVNVSGNRDLMLNTMAWLAGEKALVSIRDRKRPDTPLVLQTKDQQLLFWLPTVYLPGFILLIGALVNWTRRVNSKSR
ncbi:MAG: GldG family protein [Candidatus Omnitrophica bacterium]|nr:GldG family protein [Candidatus Omnitrophota bacterium]